MPEEYFPLLRARRRRLSALRSMRELARCRAKPRERVKSRFWPSRVGGSSPRIGRIRDFHFFWDSQTIFWAPNLPPNSQAPRASVAPNYQFPKRSQLVAQIPSYRLLPTGNQNHCGRLGGVPPWRIHAWGGLLVAMRDGVASDGRATATRSVPKRKI